MADLMPKPMWMIRRERRDRIAEMVLPALIQAGFEISGPARAYAIADEMLSLGHAAAERDQRAENDKADSVDGEKR